MGKCDCSVLEIKYVGQPVAKCMICGGIVIRNHEEVNEEIKRLKPKLNASQNDGNEKFIHRSNETNSQ